MKARTTLPILAAGGLVAGGVLAAALANVTAGGFGVGQADLDATCLNPATATVAFDEDPYWSDGDWRVNEASLTITDATNAISCAGKEMHVTTVDANGDQLSYNVLPVAQTGGSIAMTVPLGSVVLASDITGVGISIRTTDVPVEAPQYAATPEVLSLTDGVLSWADTGSFAYTLMNYDAEATPAYSYLTGSAGSSSIVGATSVNLNALGLADGTYNIVVSGNGMSAPYSVTISGGVVQ